MAKPPKDVDPEKFIVGQGSYHNQRIAVPFEDRSEFRIDPAPMPIVAIVVHNVVFVAFFAGFYWACATYGDSGKLLIAAAAIGVGTMTCVGYTALMYYSFNKARRGGPWLIVNRLTNRVALPREGVDFDAQQIVHLQYITTKRLDGSGGGSRLSELNLVTSVDGERKRWHLLRSICTDYAFEYIIRPLLDCTDMPVVRIKDEWLGWKTTEKRLERDRHNPRLEKDRHDPRP